MLGRRALMGLIGLAPIVGPTVAKELGEIAGKMSTEGALMDREVRRAEERLAWAVGEQRQAQHIEELKWKRWQGLTKRAKALALKDPALRAVIRAHFEKHINQHPVQGIDPDLMVLKAVSPMAKLYYQRQRNIDVHVDEFFRRHTDDDYHKDDSDVFGWFVDGLMRKVLGVDPDRDNPMLLGKQANRDYGAAVGAAVQDSQGRQWAPTKAYNFP